MLHMKNIEWERNVYVNFTYMTVVFKVNMKNIEWGNVYVVNVTYEKYRVREECLCKCTYMTVVFKVNMKNIEWGKCLCKCYTWKISSERGKFM
jgi:hypothetical protein